MNNRHRGSVPGEKIENLQTYLIQLVHGKEDHGLLANIVILSCMFFRIFTEPGQLQTGSLSQWYFA